jgi:hypothetical protein
MISDDLDLIYAWRYSAAIRLRTPLTYLELASLRVISWMGRGSLPMGI